MNSIRATGGVNEQLSQLRQGNPRQRFENELNSFMQGQGLSAQQQKQVKQDLKQAVQGKLGAGFRPGELRNTVQGVLDQHGLDGKAFTNRLPSPAVPISHSAANAPSEAAFQHLLEMLDASSEEEKKPAENQPAPHDQLSNGQIDLEA